jgi:hypothetical protein
MSYDINDPRNPDSPFNMNNSLSPFYDPHEATRRGVPSRYEPGFLGQLVMCIALFGGLGWFIGIMNEAPLPPLVKVFIWLIVIVVCFAVGWFGGAFDDPKERKVILIILSLILGPPLAFGWLIFMLIQLGW